MEYRHTQISSVFLALVLIFIALNLYAYLKIPTFHLLRLIVMVNLVIFVIMLALFYSLTVEIKNKT